MLKQFAYKQFGFLAFKDDEAIHEHIAQLTEFIKIFFLKAGGKITIDFKQHTAKTDMLFFVNKSQVYKLADTGKPEGSLLYSIRTYYF